jgi:hypothetical protein
VALSAYHVAFQVVTDYDLHVRVSSSAQQEWEATNPTPDPEAPFDPEAWARDHAWDYGTQSDWVASVMYAIETGNLDWGKDAGVITDQHILSYVQTAMA